MKNRSSLQLECTIQELSHSKQSFTIWILHIDNMLMIFCVALSNALKTVSIQLRYCKHVVQHRSLMLHPVFVPFHMTNCDDSNSRRLYVFPVFQDRNRPFDPFNLNSLENPLMDMIKTDHDKGKPHPAGGPPMTIADIIWRNHFAG